MKLNVDEDSNIPDITSVEHRNRISLPQGLFGFPEIREMELVFDQKNSLSCGCVKIRKMVWLS